MTDSKVAQFTISRRHALFGVLTSSALLSLPVVAAAEEAAASPENDILVSLGNQFPAVAKRMASAKQRYWQAYRRAMKLWPTAPEEITAGYGWYQPERDIRGTAIRPDKSPLIEGEQARTVYESSYFRREIVSIDRALRRKRKRPLAEAEVAGIAAERDRLARLAEAAEAYERAREEARQAVDWGDVHAEHEAAFAAMESAVDAIMSQRAETMVGLVVKAQALSEFHRYPTARLCTAISDHSTKLAVELMRVAGQEVA